MKYTAYMKHIVYMEMEVEAEDFDEAKVIVEESDFDKFKYYDGECILTSIVDATGKTRTIDF